MTSSPKPPPNLSQDPSLSSYQWHPAARPSGLILSSPHSGRFYPPKFLAQSKLSAQMLRSSEDAFVDILLNKTPQLGAHLLTALYPRAYVDLNRPPNELDPEMFDAPLPPDIVTNSPRVRIGLGTIARRVSDYEEIYNTPLQYADIVQRLRLVYEPFHEMLAHKIAQLQKQFGRVLLLDMHSMPSLIKARATHPALMDDSAAGRPTSHQPDLVLGTRFGRSCHPHVTNFIADYFTQRGYKLAHNQPYAGGYITEHYGAPNQGIHVIQIEINRQLYMDETNVKPHKGFAPLQKTLTEFIATLAQNWADLIPTPNNHSLNAAE